MFWLQTICLRCKSPPSVADFETQKTFSQFFIHFDKTASLKINILKGAVLKMFYKGKGSKWIL